MGGGVYDTQKKGGLGSLGGLGGEEFLDMSPEPMGELYGAGPACKGGGDHRDPVQTETDPCV